MTASSRRFGRIRSGWWRDDTGSLPFAMLLSLVGISFSALLVPVVVGQVGATRTEVQRAHALHAAEAGLDVALGRIRSAHDSGVGSLAKLPCGPLSGQVSSGTDPRYDVEIVYLNADPRGHADDQAWITANRQTCRAKVTSYALLRSVGTVGATSRTLWGTYVFRTTNEPIPGGLIRVYETPTTPDLCLDAGSATPVDGTLVRMQPCSSGSPAQTFAYQTNLYIMLVSSRTATETAGMCLDAGTPHAAGALLRFKRCLDPTAPQQQWSFNARANLEGTTDGATLDGYCINVQFPDTAGSTVVLGTLATSSCNTPGLWDSRQTFAPESAVGAGAAGAATEQLVNFGQFGRCVDFPQKSNPAWLSVMPCNQAPDPENVAINQRWTLPPTAGGRVSVRPVGHSLYPDDMYCMTSPGVSNSYVDALACPTTTSTPTNMRWTVRGYTGEYATSYRIEDAYGLCLAAKDTALGDYHQDQLRSSKVIAVTCSSSPLQKWNAPPNLLTARFKDVGEK